MDKLEKPKFFSFSKLNTISGVLATIFGFIQFFIPDEYLKLQSKIIIAISLLILCFVIYLISYILSVNKFYKSYLIFHNDYEGLNNRHFALSEQFTNKCNTIVQKDRIIFEHRYVLSKILEDISNGILTVTDYEKAYLQNLYNVVYKDIEHLNYLEGENKND